MKKKSQLKELERRINHALECAIAMDEKLLVYLLTMTQLEVAQQIEALPRTSSLTMLPSVPLVPRSIGS